LVSVTRTVSPAATRSSGPGIAPLYVHAFTVWLPPSCQSTTCALSVNDRSAAAAGIAITTIKPSDVALSQPMNVDIFPLLSGVRVFY
jgi:hypothetical protein